MSAYRDELPGIEARVALLRRSRDVEEQALATLRRLELRHTARTYVGFTAFLVSLVALPLSLLDDHSSLPGVIPVLVAALIALGGTRLVERLIGATRRRPTEPRRELHILQTPIEVRRGLFTVLAGGQTVSLVFPVLGSLLWPLTGLSNLLHANNPSSASSSILALALPVLMTTLVAAVFWAKRRKAQELATIAACREVLPD